MGFLSGFSCCFQSSSGDRGTRILEEQPSSIISELCRQFSLSEMQSATNNFHNSFKVGEGSFGNVYKGYLENSSTPVAIKRCKKDSVFGLSSLKNEVVQLSQLQHPNLISLCGFCIEGTELVLVYDYMSNGSIRDHLHLIGNQKFQAYYYPKGEHLVLQSHLTRVESDVKGTIGYLDPDYAATNMFTEKSDVFSFGIVLLEVVSAKSEREINREYFHFQGFSQSLRSSANEIVDAIFKSKIDPDCWKTFVDITKRCLLMDGRERPDMGEVEMELEHALKLQEEADAKN
ncbi:receptor-like protein kinase FERONIA [Arachis stenosperma]|uniref:receptor-like protein kinase FERONIA n=1 Tax=Arachis stenosperma TaxID=217475 RepID=UPI0025ACCC49|nr:receptor-like protein kinase FERONIA [Arachis stenosperma]